MPAATNHSARSVAAKVIAGCSPVRVIASKDNKVVWVTARESDALLGFSAPKLQSDPAHALIARVGVGESPIGLTFVSQGPDGAGAAWAAAERALGPASARLRRPALRSVSADARGELDADALVAELRAERDGWGLDVLLARLPSDLDARARARAMRTLARWCGLSR